MAPKPKCIIVTGPPGAGKTTLAKKLGELLSMPVISRDEIKEGYVNTYGLPHDQLSPDTNGLVSNLFFELVSHYLRGQVSIVIEAAFQHPVWSSRIPEIQQLASPILILCAIESEIAAQRHLQRGLEDPNREFYHGDDRVAYFKKTGEIAPPDTYIPPRLDLPTIHISTVGEYIPSLEEVGTIIGLGNSS